MNIKTGLILSALVTSLLNLGAAKAEAATVGCERAGGIKCQKVRKPYHRSKVIVIPKSHRHYHAYHSPMLTALGIAIVLDAAGNAVTDKGNKVVILGEGNEVKNVYEKDGVVYLVKENS
ncbi:hypothetical protein TUM4438_30340 [Shewanella sairae]|uniref:Uncharacterized protein n=1 Tax=Shewanella sairae TaxID=190310 RepID=A0ABQ4PKU5_9GAMM|nr:hypothetical protein [Shewanella sairae]MCL1129506.1 hypothetical protein [Shewanella sairae]GIU48590.1 hypothetical protein TUM4438_30340 [Shewanella sairae]